MAATPTMRSVSTSSRALAAVLLAGFAMLCPASASAVTTTGSLEDEVQSSTVTGSGRPIVDRDLVRSSPAKRQARERRARRRGKRAGVFGRAKANRDRVVIRSATFGHTARQ
jgi:hypothetical protein